MTAEERFAEREMLLDALAARWGISRQSVEERVVVHVDQRGLTRVRLKEYTGRQATTGEGPTPSTPSPL